MVAKYWLRNRLEVTAVAIFLDAVSGSPILGNATISRKTPTAASDVFFMLAALGPKRLTKDNVAKIVTLCVCARGIW